MSFCNEFLFNATKLVTVDVEGDFAFVKDIINRAVASILPKRGAPKVDVYIHGSYANATNNFFPSKLEVMCELKIPKFNYILTDEYYISHELEYGAREFALELYEAINGVFAKLTNAKVKPPECESTEKCILIPKHGTLKHDIEITPGVSCIFNDEQGGEFAGVMLFDHDANRDIITFPKLHQKNGEMKDLTTHGNFKKMVRLFKTIRNIMTREHMHDPHVHQPIRGYFIECLLYNVPDAMYSSDNMHDNFLMIINYLAHADFSRFCCQNRIWHLFGLANEFTNERDAHKFITAVKLFYHEFDPERKTLA
jgi:hypothetical protein